jgi:hypothetical protein
VVWYVWYLERNHRPILLEASVGTLTDLGIVKIFFGKEGVVYRLAIAFPFPDEGQATEFSSNADKQ